MKFVVLVGVCIVFGIVFPLFSNSSKQCGRISWGLFVFLPQNKIENARAIHHSAIGEKKKKVAVGDARDLHVPDGSDVFVNSVPVLAREKYAGQDRQFFVRVVKLALVHVEYLSLAITWSSGDATIERKFGRYCDLFDEECGLFCWMIFHDSMITRDKAVMRAAL